jgi:hypothetical protein
MTSATLIRWSGLSVMLAGVLFGLFPLVHPNHSPDGFRSPMWIIAHLLPHVAAVLALFGLIGLFARQLHPAGWLGLVGFVTAFVGTALILTQAVVELFIIPFIGLEVPQLMEGPPPPGLDATFMLIAVLFSFGYVLLGIAVVRAAVLPRGVGVLLAVGGPLFILGSGPIVEIVGTGALFKLGGLVFGLALLWLGYGLWTGAPESGSLPATDRSRPLSASPDR